MSFLVLDKKFWQKALFVLLGAFCIFLTTLFWFGQKGVNTPQDQIPKIIPISVGPKQFKAFLADTSELQIRGLSGRESLLSDQVMLFSFTVADRYQIWMKDMRFSIDILWFDRSERVVFVKEGADPSSYPEIFVPNVPALYVLEARAGFVKENNLKIGSQISFPKND